MNYYEEKFLVKSFEFYKPVIFNPNGFVYSVFFTIDTENEYTTEKTVHGRYSPLIQKPEEWPIVSKRAAFNLENDEEYELLYKFILDKYEELHRDYPVSEHILYELETQVTDEIKIDKQHALQIPKAIYHDYNMIKYASIDYLISQFPKTMFGTKIYPALKAKIKKAIKNDQYEQDELYFYIIWN